MSMEVPLRMPDVGSQHVTFGLWLVDIGEHVYEGDRILEILIPGASIDLPSPVTGRLLSRDVLPNQPLTIGQTLGSIVSESEG